MPEERIAQEMALLIARADIREELERLRQLLQTHAKAENPSRPE